MSATTTPPARRSPLPGGAREVSELPAPPPRRVLAGWLVRVTRPVLAPLLGSTACRLASLLVGVGMFALGASAVAAHGIALAQGRPLSGLWPVVAAMAVMALVKAALRYGEQLLGHLVAFRALELLRAEVFASFIPRSPRLSPAWHSAQLLTRATKDIDRIEVLFAHTLAPVVCAAVGPIMVVGAIGAMVSWPVAGAALGLLALQLLVVPVLGTAASLRAARAGAAGRAALVQHVTDTVQGMPEVVGYGRAAARLEEMGGLDDAVARTLAPSARWAAVRRGAGALLGLAGPVAVVAVGAGGVSAGRVSAAALAGAAAAVLRLSGTVRGVEELAASLSASLASAERVWQVVHAPLPQGEGGVELEPGVSHGLEWREVDYTYPGSSAPALRGVSIRARAGQWTCIAGASGSGKSTLAHLALRFDDPQAGSILIDGTDVRGLRVESLYGRVGLVSQRIHLFRASVADNVRLAAPSASDAQVEQACRVAGIHEEVMTLPGGYGTLVGERGQSLSGGQRQRLALARVLLARPSVLILDEFTSHLDPELDASVRASVRRFLPGATVVEITHRLQWSTQADHVVVLDAGRVVQEGDPAALLQANGPLRTLASRDHDDRVSMP